MREPVLVFLRLLICAPHMNFSKLFIFLTSPYGAVTRQPRERTSVAPVTTPAVWGSSELEPGSLRWPKRHVSVPCAVTMPLDTTMGCGPVRAARPSSRGASKVGGQFVQKLSNLNHVFYCMCHGK